jgi:hypothetical protein
LLLLPIHQNKSETEITMTAIDFLATSLNRRDDKPNQDLAVEIIRSKRNDWVKELAGNLNHQDKNIRSDCIKVLYETGERGAPEMIAPYSKDFGNLLTSKNNRLIWGAMTALDMITPVNPHGIYELLPAIVAAIDKGSVITVDHGVGILARLSTFPEYAGVAFPLLLEQLRLCPSKQLPMYAEKTIIAINPANKKLFLDLILLRIPEMDKNSQKQRLTSVIVKLKNL